MKYTFLILLVFNFCGKVFSQSQYDTLSVYFDFNKAVLSDSEKEKLLSINSSDKSVIKLIAHCDTVGSASYNKRLASRRAKYIMSAASGITDPQVIIMGESEAARTKNYSDSQFRRVDIVYEFEIKSTPKQCPAIIKEDQKKESELIKHLVDFIKNDTVKETKFDLSILFYSNTDTYYPECEAELWELFDFLHYNQNITAHIRGHVCCADDYNLSANRAYKVYKFLFERSISRSRLSYKGYSNKMPLVDPEVTDEDRRLNRRVDVIFTKQ